MQQSNTVKTRGAARVEQRHVQQESPLVIPRWASGKFSPEHMSGKGIVLLQTISVLVLGFLSSPSPVPLCTKLGMARMDTSGRRWRKKGEAMGFLLLPVPGNIRSNSWVSFSSLPNDPCLWPPHSGPGGELISGMSPACCLAFQLCLPRVTSFLNQDPLF